MKEKSNTVTDPLSEKDISEVPCVKKYKCRILKIDGTRYRTMFTAKFENRKKYVRLEPGKIISSLPGTICDIFIKTGQVVKQGQPLIVFEAMKMKNKLIAPIDGKVRKIYIKKGEVIVKGQLLVEID